jgi:hypothetical protein
MALGREGLAGIPAKDFLQSAQYRKALYAPTILKHPKQINQNMFSVPVVF